MGNQGEGVANNDHRISKQLSASLARVAVDGKNFRELFRNIASVKLIGKALQATRSLTQSTTPSK